MTGRSYINVGISAAFLILIAAVPLVQTISELARGERVQAMELFSRAATPASLRAYESDLETGSVAAGFLRPWMQYAQFRLLGEAGEKAAVGFDGWYFYKPGMEYITRRPPASQPGDCPNDPLKAILAFRGQLAARGIRLLVMPVPNKESIYPERLTRRAGRDDLVVCGQTRQLLERLRASGVEVLDLFEVFSRAKQDPGEFNARALYLAQDSHWSPAGVSLAAKTVADRLRAQGWVRSGTVPYDIRPAPVRRVGDVVRMLQSPPIERFVGAEDIPCEQVVRRDTQAPYADDANAEVLVLGDSFLRIYEQDEPGSAGFVAHLARQLGQPVTSLISDGGGATLVRQELHRRPRLLAGKKVVLWEFTERDIRLAAEGWPVIPLAAAEPPGKPSAEDSRTQGTLGGVP